VCNKKHTIIYYLFITTNFCHMQSSSGEHSMKLMPAELLMMGVNFNCTVHIQVLTDIYTWRHFKAVYYIILITQNYELGNWKLQNVQIWKFLWFKGGGFMGDKCNIEQILSCAFQLYHILLSMCEFLFWILVHDIVFLKPSKRNFKIIP
jgi:hypothetical protein